MFSLISIIILIIGLFLSDTQFMMISALFAIAGGLESVAYKIGKAFRVQD